MSVEIIDYGYNLDISTSPSKPKFGLKSPYSGVTDTNNLYVEPYGTGYPYINTEENPGTTGGDFPLELWYPTNEGNLRGFMRNVCNIRAQHNCTMGEEYKTVITYWGNDVSYDSAEDSYYTMGFGIELGTNGGFSHFPYNTGTNMDATEVTVVGYDFGVIEQFSRGYLPPGFPTYYHLNDLSEYLDFNTKTTLLSYGNMTPGIWDGNNNIDSGNTPTSIQQFYNNVRSLQDISEGNYESEKDIEISSYNSHVDSDGNFTTPTMEVISSYGNNYNTVDNLGVMLDYNFTSTSGKAEFECKAKCQNPWNPYDPNPEEDTFREACGERGWFRCGCDGKIFFITQRINKEYEGYNQLEDIVRYFKVGNLPLYEPTLAQSGTSYFPYTEMVIYKTGIQHNGDIINYDNGDIYDPTQIIPSSTEDDITPGEPMDDLSQTILDITKFGHPNFEIEQTISSSYNPYRGVDFSTSTNSDGIHRGLNVCSHIEFMSNRETEWPYFQLEGGSNTNYNLVNWGDGVYYNVTDNLQDYLDIIPSLGSENNLAGQTFDCEYTFGMVGQVLKPVNEINVVCKNGKKIPICKSIGLSCASNNQDFSFIEYTGNGICQHYAETENNELYFSANEDGRIGLGLYYFDEYDDIDLQKKINSNSELFEENDTLINLISNGDGKDIESNTYYTNILGDNSFKPNNWGYFIRDGVNGEGSGAGYELSNQLSRANWRALFKQENNETGYLYTGYLPYILPYVASQNFNSTPTDRTFTSGESSWEIANPPGIASKMEWARWIESRECYSHNKCLQFSASSAWSNTENMVGQSAGEGTSYPYDGTIVDWPSYNFRNHNHNQYRTINQAYNIRTEDVSNLDVVTELEISFFMNTLKAPKMEIDYNNGMPEVEAMIYSNHRKSYPFSDYASGDKNNPRPCVQSPEKKWHYHQSPSDGFSDRYYVQGATYQHGTYNSLYPETNVNITGEQNFSAHGSSARFQNTGYNLWQKFSYTFKLSNHYKNPFETVYIESQLIKDLTFVIQASGEFEGNVLLDNFSVKESFDFTPDVYTVNNISQNNYSKNQLTKYLDSTLLDDSELETVEAPIRVGFYFYPRYNSNYIFDITKPINFEDFKLGKYYIYNINWGDGEIEYDDEPFKINYSTMLYHYYAKNGIYKVTGNMLRIKTKYRNSDNDITPMGISKNKRFELYININQGSDEDFTYFNMDGFSFIPYKNTSPVIGGYSNKSYYYKTIKRQLGFIGDDKVDINFLNESDKLKTELALLKMDSSDEDRLQSVSEYIKPRMDGEVLVYKGISPIKNELGESIGDADLTNIKYYNTPKQMWEILGFESDITEKPDEERYWKNIIPKDYSIYNREGLDGTYILPNSQQDWLEDENGNIPYYPVLPKYGTNGKFIEGDYPNNKIPFPLKGPITDEYETNENLKINIINEKVENNVLEDSSGNKNLGFYFSDYKPLFDYENLKVKNIKKTDRIRTSKTNGTF